MKKGIRIAVLVLSTSVILHAQNEQVRSGNFNLKKNLAIDGYDVVSYFDHKPQEGKEEILLNYNGVSYRFSTSANREKFKTNPEKYEPAYGGWCAFAMGETGEKVKIDPETYKIINDKLYLFYNFWGTNTLKDWNQNEKKLKDKGDQNWKRIVGAGN